MALRLTPSLAPSSDFTSSLASSLKPLSRKNAYALVSTERDTGTIAVSGWSVMSMPNWAGMGSMYCLRRAFAYPFF